MTKSKVINNPIGLIKYNEKLSIFNFTSIPSTIVSGDSQTILTFIKKYKVVVIKSLCSYQGKKVDRVSEGITSKLLSKKYIENIEFNGALNGPVMVQEFLPNISQGDKRVILIGGKFLGAYSRIPKPNSYLSSTYLGSKIMPTDLNHAEKKIIKEIGEFSVVEGIHLAAIDLIDSKLTEINITCPTGIPDMNRAYNKSVKDSFQGKVVDYFTKFSVS